VPAASVLLRLASACPGAEEDFRPVSPCSFPRSFPPCRRHEAFLLFPCARPGFSPIRIFLLTGWEMTGHLVSASVQRFPPPDLSGENSGTARVVQEDCLPKTAILRPISDPVRSSSFPFALWNTPLLTATNTSPPFSPLCGHLLRSLRARRHSRTFGLWS